MRLLWPPHSFSLAGRIPSAVLWALLALACVAGTVRAAPREGEALVHFTLVVALPDTIPNGETVFLSTDHDGWRPDNPKFRLQPRPDGRWQVTLASPAGLLLHFLFCRGTWDAVEVRADGSPLDARRLRPQEGTSYELSVARWADTDLSTITGNVEAFVETSFLHGRRCWVYLPPGYEDGDRRYPVLYMHDGQNLFDKERSYAGEWQVDETLERMIGAGEIPPLIVVGIENGGPARIEEYTPWRDLEWNSGGGGERYLRAVADTLKPSIDRHFRTLPGAAHTYMAGSSLGGLISAYAAFTHGDVFGGGVAAVSPSYWWAQGRILQFAREAGRPRTRRFYQDMGTREISGSQDKNHDEVEDSIATLRTMDRILREDGMIPEKDLLSIEAEGHRHRERDWAQRLPKLLRFLMADE